MHCGTAQSEPANSKDEPSTAKEVGGLGPGLEALTRKALAVAHEIPDLLLGFHGTRIVTSSPVRCCWARAMASEWSCLRQWLGRVRMSA